MPKQLLKSPEQGIDESCAEKLCMMVKRFSVGALEAWCRDCVRPETDVVNRSLPWFRYNINESIPPTVSSQFSDSSPSGILSFACEVIVRWLQAPVDGTAPITLFYSVSTGLRFFLP